MDYILDKDKDSAKDVKRVDKPEKKNESASSGQSEDANKKEKDGNEAKGITGEEKIDGNDKRLEKKGGSEAGEENKVVEKKELGESGVQMSGSVKSGKRKIIRKIVKQKVVDKTAGDSISIQNDKLDGKDNEEKNVNSENLHLPEESAVAPSGVKTFVRKKVIRKVPVGKTARNEGVEVKPKDSADPNSASVVQGTGVKTTVKKKIIKRVAKRKIAGLVTRDTVADTKKGVDGDDIKVVSAVGGPENSERQAADAGNQVSDINRSQMTTVPMTSSKALATKKQDDVVGKTEVKADKDEKRTGEKSDLGSKVEIEADKQKVPENDNHGGKGPNSKDGENSRDEKEKKDNDGKDESRSKSNKELKEKRKPEESPRHPGLILQTKWTKDSKVG